MTQATRVEIVEAIGSCFEEAPVSRDDLIHQALSIGADPGVIEVLERLPNRSFGHVRQIWELVPGVPVDR